MGRSARGNGGVPGLSGTIKTLKADKGFGFIKPSDGGPELFFHRSACDNFDLLQVDDAVMFDEGQDLRGKGPRAENVRRA